MRALGARGASADHDPHPRPRRPGPRVHARRVRGRGRRLGPRDQPVRPAQRAAGQGRHQATCSPATKAITSCPRCADADEAALRELLLGEPRRRSYVALMGYASPRPSSTRRSRSCARRSAIATPSDDDVRLRPALPALDRAVPQGRPEDRALPAADPRRRHRRRDPGRAVHVPTLEERAGDRRPGDAARARPAGRARASAGR